MFKKKITKTFVQLVTNNSDINYLKKSYNKVCK